MELDLKTLYLVTVTICFVSGGAFFLSWSYNHRIPGLRGWALALIIGGIGALLLGLRGAIPDVLSYLIANTLIVSGVVTIWISVRRFNSGSLGFGPAAAIVGVFAASYLVGWELGHDPQGPRAILTGFLSALFLLIAREVVAGGKSEPLRSRLPTAIVFALMGTAFLGRTLFLSLDIVPLVTQGVALYLVNICLFTFNIGMLMMANERLRNRYESLASTDELTGISNRRVLMEKGERLSRRSVVGNTPVCILLMDLDRFRSINRRFGHEGGDRALKAFAAYTHERIRPTDIFGRYGGEEFCALLQGTSVMQGKEIAERLRAGLENLAIQMPDQPISITMSVGVAPLLSGDLKTSIREADIALYEAKKLGRNRVCIRQPEFIS